MPKAMSNTSSIPDTFNAIASHRASGAMATMDTEQREIEMPTRNLADSVEPADPADFAPRSMGKEDGAEAAGATETRAAVKVDIGRTDKKMRIDVRPKRPSGGGSGPFAGLPAYDNDPAAPSAGQGDQQDNEAFGFNPRSGGGEEHDEVQII